MLLSHLLSQSGLDDCEIFSKNRSDAEISRICPDSRRVEGGDMYVAVNGLRSDGHRYVYEAVEKGAYAVVVEKEALLDGRVDRERISVPIIAVERGREACARLFAAWHHNPQKRLRIVGVTGTNGKTSVSRLTYEILTRSGIRAGLIGTMGCISSIGEIGVRPQDPTANMTTPDPEELYEMLEIMADGGVDTVIMEVTSHALYFEKTAPICFETAIFTNLTEDHLDLHGDMESYFNAKSRLFEACKRAIINIDDKYGRRLAERVRSIAVSCSAEGREAICYAEDIRQKGIFGCEYKLISHDIRLRVRTSLAGGFNVMNTMQAALCARMLGASVSNIQSALMSFSGIEGRLERVRIKEPVEFSVFIDYAHTPDALENLLRTARGFCRGGGRLVLLFGCGGDRERQKRALMGGIATALADFVVITSDNSRSERAEDIISDILSGVCPEGSYTVIEDRRKAIEYVIKNAVRGDVILLAGKGHESYEIVGGERIPFSEKEIVLAATEKYY